MKKKICDYGCGKTANFYFTTVDKWCCSKSQNSCDSIKNKISKSLNKPEVKEKLKIPKSEEVKKKMKESQNTPESIKKKSESHLKYFSSLENRKKYSISSIKRFSFQENRKKLSESMRKPETRIKTSQASIRNWKNLKFVEKQRISRSIRPNKPETLILNLLNELFPNEWQYTGDFSFMINGKNPDFTNINGQKKLIELFGDYWHKGEDPEDRKSIFKEFGYETLVIWEHELKNKEFLKEKILTFHLSDLKI